MADDGVVVREINWREAFGFTHLFRGFRIAVHPSKLVLALVALGCLWCGGLILDVIWPSSYQVTSEERAALYRGDTRATFDSDVDAQLNRYLREYRARREETANPGVFHTFFDYEVGRANDVLMVPAAVFRSAAYESIWQFIKVGPVWLWTKHWVFALIYTAWFLLIWSLFGGAISRIAAVHVARDEKISVRHALTFSGGKVLSFVFAPIIPVLIVLGIGLTIALTSTVLLHIPWVGPIVAGLFFFLALLGGFIITLVVLGTIGGFNLMYPTVAVEGSDSFDAISRSFSYVFARPWRMLWYTVVALVYGAICYLFVRFFVYLVLATTWFFMAWLLGGQHAPPADKSPADVWPRIWSQPVDPLASLRWSPDYDHLKGTEAVAAGLIVWWTYLVIGLVGAFAISYYFSANTIIYFLMRREVDATEMDDVYVQETDDAIEEPLAAGASPTGTTVVSETVVTVQETPSPPPVGEPAPPPPPEPPPA